MKETIKIAYADFWPEWTDENFIQPILEKKYNVIVDQKNPDVLFHSIFGNTQTKYKCKKILYVAENIRYNYNDQIRNNINSAYKNANYTITFDPHTETNFRLPLWQVFILRHPALLVMLDAGRKRYDNFDNFGAFVVSNPSNQLRNSHFDVLSSYKKVKSYGKVRMNDFGLNRASKGRYWRDAKQDFFEKNTHKFFMAYENTSYPYYCTEKLMDAFTAGSVPIYWGDPKVKEDWNSESFVNIIDHGSNWLDVIKKLDKEPAMFDDMYNQPLMTNSQQKKLMQNLTDFENWIIKAING